MSDEDKLVIFSCEDLVLMSGVYPKTIIREICEEENWKLNDTLEFEGFVYVLVS